ISFSLMLIDVDHFKKINDTYGHLAGDEVLRSAASQIRSCAGSADLCFRYGGEEFGILVRSCSPVPALRMAERIRKAIAEVPNPTGGPVHVSIGIAHSGQGRGSASELIGLADKALYQSKV